ncbi:MAG: hypothetical protein RLZZ519_810 [Bacteroidota bacterium]
MVCQRFQSCHLMSSLNSLIQKLVPKDKRFYPLFDAFADAVKGATESYSNLLTAKDAASRAKFAAEVAAAEEKGDVLIHKVMTELTATFLTPFDREDIHQLAVALDGILDQLNGGASRITLYEIDDFPASLLDLGSDLKASGAAAAEAVHLLKSTRNPKLFAEKIQAIQERKARADETFMHALAKLYRDEQDVVKLLKLREVYYSAEGAMDFFAELSFALEAILIKTT